MELFGYVKSLQTGKHVSPTDNYKKFSPYMANKFLSMNFRNLELCNLFNKYIFMEIPKASFYNMMFGVRWDSKYAPYIKGSKSNNLQTKLVDTLCEAWSTSPMKRSDIELMVKHKTIEEEDLIDLLISENIEMKIIKKFIKVYNQQEKQ